MPEDRDVPIEQMCGKVDFGIITVRTDEFQAVLDRFPAKCLVHGQHQYNIRELISGKGKFHVAVICTGESGGRLAECSNPFD
jgi:hypothetical protein